MSELKLKRCPFAKCGGEGQLFEGVHCLWVRCTKCGTFLADFSMRTREDAITAWNDRTPEPWLPIETAPKDETRVDLWCGGMFRFANCVWSEEDNCWEDDWGHLLKATTVAPTHWMPIPPAPKETA